MITETEIRNLDKIKDEFSEPKKWLLLVAWLKKLTNNMSNLLKLKKEIIEVKKENKVLETEIKLDKWERWKQLSCKKTESKEKAKSNIEATKALEKSAAKATKHQANTKTKEPKRPQRKSLAK